MNGVNYLKWPVILLISVNLIGCFGPEGAVEIKADRDNLLLYINGDRKTSIGQESVSIKLKTGNYNLELKGISDDGEWSYYAKDSVEIEKDITKKKNIVTEIKPTKKRIARLAYEAKLREANELAIKVKEYWEKK